MKYKSLEEEAEEYYESLEKIFSEKGCQYPDDNFIAGANSKYVKIEKIKALIEENQSVLRMLKQYGDARNRLPIVARITELQEELYKICES
jgi:hypothetical protein